MRFRVVAICAIMLSSAGGASAQSFYNLTCGELWMQRNSIYKANGYCFNTQRGISVFGNAGCQFDRVGDVPLSRGDRAQINAIVAVERAKGCSN